MRRSNAGVRGLGQPGSSQAPGRCTPNWNESSRDWKGAERALLFPTGFAANLGVLSVVGGPDVTIISDQLNHASIIDGCRLARGEVRIYRHGDIGQVDRLLRDADRAVVVTDSVFSMDGDLAPLAELARLARPATRCWSSTRLTPLSAPSRHGRARRFSASARCRRCSVRWAALSRVLARWWT